MQLETATLAPADMERLLTALAQPNVIATIQVTIKHMQQPAKTAAEHWTTKAAEIARRIHTEQPTLTQDDLARHVRAEMVERIAEPGMSKRGGSAPSVGSIVRHCLAGLATSSRHKHL